VALRPFWEDESVQFVRGVLADEYERQTLSREEFLQCLDNLCICVVAAELRTMLESLRDPHTGIARRITSEEG
jgi:hypothetical protein